MPLARTDDLPPEWRSLQAMDCHAAVGRWTVPPPAGPLDEAGLLAELDAAGVAGALVHHGVARDYDPAVGNDLLLAACASDRLVPCATLLPPATAELPPPDEHLPALLAAGVRAVRLYPRSHNFSLAPWCSGPLLEALERRRVPLTVDLVETDWEAIHGLCERYPDLPVVVTRVNYRQERFLYALWERHANLHVELSLFQGHRSLEEAVERFGPHRLLFGTGLPFFDAGGPVVMLARCEVDAAARRAMAGDNLRRLLGNVVAPAPAAPALPEGAAR